MNFSSDSSILLRTILAAVFAFTVGCDDESAGGQLPEATTAAAAAGDDDTDRDDLDEGDEGPPCFFDRQCDPGFECDSAGEGQRGICVPTEEDDTDVEMTAGVETVGAGGDDNPADVGGSDDGAPQGGGHAFIGGEETTAGMTVGGEDEDLIDADSGGDDSGTIDDLGGEEGDELDMGPNGGGDAGGDDHGDAAGHAGDRPMATGGDASNEEQAPTDPEPELIDGSTLGEQLFRGQVLLKHIQGVVLELEGDIQARLFRDSSTASLDLPHPLDPQDIWPGELQSWVTDDGLSGDAHCILQHTRVLENDGPTGTLSSGNVPLGDTATLQNGAGILSLPYIEPTRVGDQRCTLELGPHEQETGGSYYVANCSAPTYRFWDGEGENISVSVPGHSLWQGAFDQTIRSPIALSGVTMDVESGELIREAGTDFTWVPGNGNWIQVTLTQGSQRLRCSGSDSSGTMSISGDVLSLLDEGDLTVEVSRVVYGEFLTSGSREWAFEIQLESAGYPNGSGYGEFTAR